MRLNGYPMREHDTSSEYRHVFTFRFFFLSVLVILLGGAAMAVHKYTYSVRTVNTSHLAQVEVT